jgi:hypothetical protein
MSTFPFQMVFDIPLGPFDFVRRRFPRLFDKVVKQYERVVSPIEKQNAMSRWAQFPKITVTMLHLRFTDACAVNFQSPDMRENFPILYAGIFVGSCFFPQAEQNFLYRLVTVLILMEIHFEHEACVLLPSHDYHIFVMTLQQVCFGTVLLHPDCFASARG